MTFRRRLTIASATAVALAVALASLVAWFVVRGQLRGEIDEQLRDRAGLLLLRIAAGGAGEAIPIPDPALLPGQLAMYVQLVTPDGTVVRGGQGPPIAIPVPPELGRPTFEDVTIGGTHYRVHSEPAPGGGVLSLALPLTDVDGSLRRLALILLLVTVAGSALALALGSGVTSAAATPVARLTTAAERVRETGDLTLRIEEPGSEDDELGRLASTFNAMLAALEGSVAAQRRLVADASHELRTPLTSIRTNLDVLASGTALDPAEGRVVLDDVRAQLEELTALVNDLVELARDGDREVLREEVRLDEVAALAVARARTHARDRSFLLDAGPSVVVGDAARLERAIANVLDNATKWGPPGSPIEVRVDGGAVTVRDHGPGFAEEDLANVFDRFYRSATARSTPGSGLGLAIVRQVMQAHGGRAAVSNAEDGGAIVRLELPDEVRFPPPPS